MSFTPQPAHTSWQDPLPTAPLPTASHATDPELGTQTEVHLLALAQLRTRIQVHLDRFLAEKTEQLHAISPQLDQLSEVAHSLLASGKRLRAAFAVWGWRAALGPHTNQYDTDDQVIAACASLELLQACALLHDDVMDASTMRRGQPSAHRRLQAMHQRNGWHGDSARFGEAAAILLGDLALGWTDEMFFASGLDSHLLLRAHPALNAMRTEVSAGQYLDALAQASRERDPQAIERVLLYKSAKYTVQRPLHLGGLLADANQQVLQAYSGYGHALGIAFQLRDDVLGVIGDPAQTGKPAGDDIREGKRTLLMSVALQQADHQQRQVITNALGRSDLDVCEVEAVQQVFQDTGAFAHIERRIIILRNQALEYLHQQQEALHPEAFNLLEHLAHASTTRNH